MYTETFSNIYNIYGWPKILWLKFGVENTKWVRESGLGQNMNELEAS